MIEARFYIDENFNLPEFSITLLAERIEMSEVYLRKLFRAQYGISPSKYLISVRLKNAKKLMKYPFLTLEECALQSGFSSLQYFCRLFKKETGISPGKYRKEL
ncbi:MAG: helix-turn-helix transcriptional regulator [Ruminococcaceae bacterium]|nr:helix-turn-helix transcriptional regulator [Oscillospiraceae bacterium]